MKKDHSQKKSGTKIFLTILGVLMILILGAIGVTLWGVGEFSDEIENILSENIVVEEQIGEIEKFKLDWMATAEEDDGDVFVFKIEGTTGKGIVRALVETNDENLEELISGSLILEDGQEFELFE